MGVASQKLRDSARGQECTLQILGVCNHDPETTILAHLPSEVKGAATKSDDWNACFSCSSCHDAIDRYQFSTDVLTFYMFRGLQRTQKIWRDMGLIVIAGDVEKPRKPSTKTVQRSPLYARGS